MKYWIAAIAICSGLIAIWSSVYEQQVMLSISKSLTTLLIIYGFFRATGAASGALWWGVFCGLWFCLLGDVMLLQESRFVYGLTAFLVAHLLFLVAFVSVSGWQWHVQSAIPLIVISLFFWLFLKDSLGEMLLPVSIYSLVITTMAWQGIAVALQRITPTSWMIAVGACLFMFSDSMIAINKFFAPFWWSPIIILSTYWAGISLIAIGSASLVSERRLAGQ